MPTIKAIHSTNFEVAISVPDLDAVEGMIQTLRQRGYRPTGAIPVTPEGLPLCTRHGEVMRERNKQGDTWYSHRVIDPATGEELWCKGRAGKDSPGWQVEPTQAADPEPVEGPTTSPPAPPPPAEERRFKQRLARQEARQSQTQAQPVDSTRDRQSFHTLAGEAIQAGKVHADKVNEFLRVANIDGWGAALAGLKQVIA